MRATDHRSIVGVISKETLGGLVPAEPFFLMTGKKKILRPILRDMDQMMNLSN